MRFFVYVAFFLIAFSGSVAAADAVQLDVAKSEFKLQQDSILKALNTDPEYGEISASERMEVTSALARIDSKVVQSPFASLNEQDRIQVLQDQALVNAGLAKAKSDSRMVCKREAVIGSNFAKRVCRTSASLKRENDKVRDESASGTKPVQ